MVAGYYRMISGVDLAIGRIIKQITASGLADNTVIVFLSDNGYFLGERGFADKWYIYEPSIRVPPAALQVGRGFAVSLPQPGGHVPPPLPVTLPVRSLHRRWDGPAQRTVRQRPQRRSAT